MFGNLKQKLSKALQEGVVISESLQQQYRQRVSSRRNVQTSQATKPTTTTIGGVLHESISSQSSSQHLGDQLPDGASTQLNLSVGCNLMSNYEDDWQQIHAANQENVGNALAVANKINAILQRAGEQRRIINELNSCLAGVHALVITLNGSLRTLQSLEQMGEKLEMDLEKLDNFCEEFELQEFVLAHQFQLSKHKQTKLNKLEQYRQQIAEKHQQNIRNYEHQLQQLQKERQAVFDDAFRGDLEEYIQHGQLPKIVPKTKELSLEEVVLDQNDFEAKDALEQFLNS